MKLWIESSKRPVPEGWVRVETAAAAVALLGTGLVTEIAIAHDLDEPAHWSGTDVLEYIRQSARTGKLTPPSIRVNEESEADRGRMVAIAELIAGEASRERTGLRMKPSDALALHRDEIRQIVERNDAFNPRIFGSALHGDDTSDSDLDLLVDPIRDKTTLLSLVNIEREIEELTGVTAHLHTPMSLHERFRQQVLNEAVPL